MAPFKLFTSNNQEFTLLEKPWLKAETLIKNNIFSTWKIKSSHSSSDQTVNSEWGVTWNNLFSSFLIKNNILVETTHLSILLTYTVIINGT